MQLTATLNFEGKTEITRVDKTREKITVTWDKVPEKPELTLKWALPLVDIQYEWYPGCKFNRALHVDWQGPVFSRIASQAPVFCFYNGRGMNRFTMALSDAEVCAASSLGVREEDGTLCCVCRIPFDTAGRQAYTVELYRDSEEVSFAKALRRVSAYWENECGYKAMHVPDAARDAMYSFWYSFHQATFAADLEAECARAAELGFKSVIVDDGWQTDDGSRGYAYCGDWEPAKAKIPDMAKHVENVHSMGLKYILWYSVPFLGKYSKHWDTYKDKLIGFNEWNGAGVLDPRYPEVRKYLVDTYVRALKEWRLDGFKLDFIDQFSTRDGRNPDVRPGMDIPILETAVKALMTEVREALTAINPDILIEFRQSYIGPVMRTYGNMFRVGDCPADPMSNRVGVIDLRLLSGTTAVHSDMLMWHRDETPEAAALQILATIFGVMQFSVKLDTLSDAHRALLRYWFGFMRRHRDLLLDAPIEVESPENLYPLVKAEKDGKAIIAIYQAEKTVKLTEKLSEVIILNANFGSFLPVKAQGAFRYETRTCTGALAENGTITINGIAEISIPPCGSVKFTRI